MHSLEFIRMCDCVCVHWVHNMHKQQGTLVAVQVTIELDATTQKPQYRNPFRRQGHALCPSPRHRFFHVNVCECASIYILREYDFDYTLNRMPEGLTMTTSMPRRHPKGVQLPTYLYT